MLLSKSVLCIGIAGSLLCGGMLFDSGKNIASADDFSLTIYGEATKDIKPDCAKIYGTIENISFDGEFVKNSVFDSYELLKSKLGEINVNTENLVSTYYYEGAYCVDCQFVLKNTLDFFVYTEDIDNIATLLQTIEGVDLINIKSITYELKDDTAYQQLLQVATENALQKAENLVKMDSLQVKEIKEENFYSFSSYKNFVSVEDESLIKDITVKAKVKITLSEIENQLVEIEENIE